MAAVKKTALMRRKIACNCFISHVYQTSRYKNFEQKLNSMKNILNLWKSRSVTLHGRIIILKSLALSKLVNNTSVLSFPPQFTSSVKSIISQFVWNNQPKIKHNTMIGPKIKGGLDMPDFKIISNAFKVTWIRRLHESSTDASWSHIPHTPRSEGATIQFYKDALNIWQMINQRTPENEEQILKEILWNNRFIKIEGLSVYYNSWYKAGVIRIKDIFYENGFLTFKDFCHTFRVQTNFLTYNGLCNAILQNWIRLLKHSNLNDSHNNNSECVEKIPLNQKKKQLSCKSASRFLIEQKFVAPTPEQRMIQANLNKQTIETIYSIPFRETKDIRLAIFQFKIVHHILPTNATLFRDKII